jgi:hypothetical protein
MVRRIAPEATALSVSDVPSLEATVAMLTAHASEAAVRA